MAIVHVFCFWFSLRLGAIIIAVTTVIQCVILLAVDAVYLQDVPGLSGHLRDGLNMMKFNGDFVKWLRLLDETETYLIVYQTFFVALALFSGLMILGAVQCKTQLIYGFVILYAVYIFHLVLAFILAMRLIKMQNSGLGELIIYANLGGFLLLFYLYTWISVWNLIEVIKELQRRIDQKDALLLLSGQRHGQVYRINK